MNKIPLKNLVSEKINYRRHFLILVSIILMPILCIFIRLIYLQIINYKHYQTMSTKNLLSIVAHPAARGLIYDRNHVLLAGNNRSYVLAITPERTTNVSSTIQQLKNIIPLSQSDIKTFHLTMNMRRPYQAIEIGPYLNPQQIARISVKQYLYPGVTIIPKYHRFYPMGSITAPVVGYTGRISNSNLSRKNTGNYDPNTTVGKLGIEKSYEQDLRGEVGITQIETNVTGHTVKSLQNTPAQAGDNITLTIDSKLQKVAMDALGEQHGALVAINPQNGEILALASKPSYEPNLLINGLSSKTYHRLFDTGKETLFNKATQGLYSVASTIKPFLAIGALSLGVITPQEKVFDPGWFKIKNTHHIYHDWKLGGHGWVNVKRAIIVSCDTYFYNLAIQLGIKKLSYILQAFGFGQKTNIDLPGEKAGVIPQPSWKLHTLGKPWYQGDTVLTAIGQEYQLATPLQLAFATAELANHGNLIKPHLLLSRNSHIQDLASNQNELVTTSDSKKHIIPTFFPKQSISDNNKLFLKNITNKQWDFISTAMQQVITSPYGTGLHFGRNPAYTVAAKTGTSQVFGHQRNEESSQEDLPKKLRNNHLFIAYAPIKNPQIALAIVVEHDAIAAKVSRRVLDYYLLTENHLPKS